MRATFRRTPFRVPVRAGMVAVVLIGLEACVPGNMRFGFGGISLSSRGGVGLGLGLFNGMSFPGQSAGGQGHQGQYSLPTATSGPREVAATFQNEAACEDRISPSFGHGFTAYDPAAGAPACYACPDGYERAGPSVPLDDPFACRATAGTGLFQTAEHLGPPGCAEGSFAIDDGCYTCPADMTPTGNPDPGTACLAAN